MKRKILVGVVGCAGLLLLYSLIGTSGNVDEIKKRLPQAFAERNWKVLRYEGFKYGSWSKHGGSVWYHVADADNPAIQYRVNVSLWNGELQFYYNSPEVLNRIVLTSLK